MTDFAKYNHIDNKYLYEHSKNIFNIYKTFFRKLTKDEKKSLNEYKQSGYQNINEVLKKKEFMDVIFSRYLYDVIEKLQKLSEEELKNLHEKNLRQIFIDIINEPITYINNIDKIFDKVEINKLSLPLFRGITSKKELKGITKGSTIKFSEYLSTSISPSTAFKFEGCGKYPCCIFVFHISDKIPYIPLYYRFTNKYLSFNDELEMLLPRSTSWKVVKQYKTEIYHNNAIMCSYKNIEKSKKKKIMVYELVPNNYIKPKQLKAIETDKYGYLTNYKTKKPFIIQTSLQLEEVNTDDKK